MASRIVGEYLGTIHYILIRLRNDCDQEVKEDDEHNELGEEPCVVNSKNPKGAWGFFNKDRGIDVSNRVFPDLKEIVHEASLF